MQQPPYGRPTGTPYGPPPGGPPRGPAPGGRPPQAPPPPGATPGYAQPPHAQPAYSSAAYPLPPPPRKKRGALKFVAGTCVISAWLTLLLSIVFAGVSFMAGVSVARLSAGSGLSAPSGPPPNPVKGPLGDGDALGGGALGGALGGLSGSEGSLGQVGGGLGNPGAAGMPLLVSFIPAVCYGSAVLTLVTGIGGFFLFLGLGQACYALLELEEQSFQTTQILSAILSRLGAGR